MVVHIETRTERTFWPKGSKDASSSSGMGGDYQVMAWGRFLVRGSGKRGWDRDVARC